MSTVDPLIVPKAALMVVLPVATLLAKPWALIVATAGVEDDQVTDEVMSWVLLSENAPVAVYCFVVLTAMLEFAGVTAIESSVAPETMSDAVPLTEPEVAVMVVLPVPVLAASPVESIAATEVAEELQVTSGNNCVLPSSKVPTALNCCVVPSAMVGVAGLTEIETKCAATTVRVAVSVKLPTVAVIVVVPAPVVVASPEALMVATEFVDEFHDIPVIRSALEPSL